MGEEALLGRLCFCAIVLSTLLLGVGLVQDDDDGGGGGMLASCSFSEDTTVFHALSTSVKRATSCSAHWQSNRRSSRS